MQRGDERGNFSGRAAGLALASALALAGFTAGCSDPAPPLRFVELRDESYVGGEQVTRFEIDSGFDVRSSELYLDGLRVAVDELAPFELRWSTSEFEESKHRLKVRAYLTDGDYLEAELGITIDNTPPTLGELATGATAGELMSIQTSDNFGVDRLEISTYTSGAPLVVRKPFSFVWPGPCGAVTATVRAIDFAGLSTVRTFTVQSVDFRDADCDGHRAANEQFGDDCNDAAAWIHPGAPEVPEGFDTNCDGMVAALAGTDNDLDGVLSFSDGGEDCDDTNGAIHGGKRVYTSEQVIAAGAAQSWLPGEAALSIGGSAWRLLLNRGGTIDEIDSLGQLQQLATGANPSSIAGHSNGVVQYVAFGRANNVVILRNTGSTWIEHAVIAADSPVGKLAITKDYGSKLFVVFQAGTRVWSAWATEGGAWTSRLLAEAAAPLGTPPSMPSYNSVSFGTSSSAWKSLIGDGSMAPTTKLLSFAGSLQAIANDGSATFVAVEHMGGSLLSVQDSYPPLANLKLNGRVRALWAQYPHVFVNTQDGATLVLNYVQGFRATQPSLSMSFDTATYDALAGGGSVHFHDYARSLRAKLDELDDGIDFDCDGTDR